ncbi:MAG: hypothetical protein ACI3YC_02055 [Alloprevotella sp.]
MSSILKNLKNEARQFSLHDPEEDNAPTTAPESETGGTEVKTNETTTWLVLTAQVISLIYSPFYLPVFAFVALFSFSYLNLLPFLTKVWLTLLVFFFTVLLPRLGIYVYRKLNGWTKHQMGRRQRRYVPYVLCIISYAALLSLLYKLHMPRFTLGVIAGALTIQVVCTILNSRVKVSMHAAASGGVIGALMAFSLIFSFNPTGWLCLTTLLCGMVCTARLILRQHTPRDLGWGVFVGVLCGFFCIVLI